MSELRRCRTHGLHYDPTESTGCALCRSLDARLEREQPSSRTPWVVAGLVMVGVVWTFATGGRPIDATVSAVRRLIAESQPVTWTAIHTLAIEPGDAGAARPESRTCGASRERRLRQEEAGASFVPAGRPIERLPIMVLVSSAEVRRELRSVFEALGAEHGFAVLTPTLEETGPDAVLEGTTQTVVASLDTLDDLPCVVPNRARTLVVGHGPAAQLATRLATTSPEFSEFALLHGGPPRAELGPRHVRGWLSSGFADRDYPFAAAERDAATLRELGFQVQLRSVVGSRFSKEEAQALVFWWLAP